MFDILKTGCYTKIVSEGNKVNIQMAIDGVIDKERVDETINIFSSDYEKCFLAIFKEIKGVSVCFTGNRPASLPWRYNEDCELCVEFKERLKHVVRLLCENGFKKFITGMAMGFDMIIAELVLQLKEEGFLLELECVIPCLNQTEGWQESYKHRYKKIIDMADSVTYASQYNYFSGCYAIRNQYMVDCVDLVVGCQFKESKGTKSTIDYARKKNRDLVIFNY